MFFYFFKCSWLETTEFSCHKYTSLQFFRRNVLSRCDHRVQVRERSIRRISNLCGYVNNALLVIELSKHLEFDFIPVKTTLKNMIYYFNFYWRGVGVKVGFSADNLQKLGSPNLFGKPYGTHSYVLIFSFWTVLYEYVLYLDVITSMRTLGGVFKMFSACLHDFFTRIHTPWFTSQSITSYPFRTSFIPVFILGSPLVYPRWK